VDQELLRRRAEHNDGDLSTLREVALHQYDLERIENLDIYCRHLEILYLQNNQIMKIAAHGVGFYRSENLGKLKELQYLQLALNNIRVIENLEGCESLSKLDLTVNFVEDPLDVESLKGNERLRELFLVGNPCTQKEGYRDFVVATLPQLRSLDGREIDKSERILAAQSHAEIRERLVREREERLSGGGEQQAPFPASPRDLAEHPPSCTSATDAGASTASTEWMPVESGDEEMKATDSKRWSFQNEPVPHTPEARLAAARDLHEMKEKIPSSSAPPAKTSTRPLIAPDGRVLQCNQGKWPFNFSITPSTIVLTIEVPRMVDTSLMDVDVHPTHIRVTVKGKVLQLLLEDEVRVEGTLCERSRASGKLVVTMLRACAEGNDVVDVRQREWRDDERLARMAKKEESKPVEKGATLRNRRYERLFEPGEAVDIRNIVPGHGKKGGDVVAGMKGAKIRDLKAVAEDTVSEDFDDDPSVPPLC
ncbi:hypothetical protein BDK51DRAFT_15741, partial [Blyttiomyces helicus]